MTNKVSFRPYAHPAGGWGSARSLGTILSQEGVLASGPMVLSRQYKVDGFQCVSCAWSKPANPLPFEFCENGAKATAWEITAHRCEPSFFAEHTVTDLLTWDDFHLEQAGRLTQPAALRRGQRPLFAGVLVRRLRRDRAGIAGD
jgi:anaerobic selenocysteine-containing dehydrogenase